MTCKEQLFVSRDSPGTSVSELVVSIYSVDEGLRLSFGFDVISLKLVISFCPSFSGL